MSSEVLKKSGNSLECATENFTKEKSMKYLTVNISEDLYCIGLDSITEIILINRIFQVEDMPRSVRGVINLRGSIIPIIDLKLLFDGESTGNPGWINIVILNIKENLIGLVVDSIQKIVSLSSEEISALAHFKNLTVVDKINKTTGILLDAEKIVEAKELSSISESIEKYLRPMDK